MNLQEEIQIAQLKQESKTTQVYQRRYELLGEKADILLKLQWNLEYCPDKVFDPKTNPSETDTLKAAYKVSLAALLSDEMNGFPKFRLRRITHLRNQLLEVNKQLKNFDYVLQGN